MEQQPLVSVIINCYNGEKYLREAIDSVITQTYTNWELIFWDNQSTDSTAEIVKSYKDDRIRYFYAPEHTTLGEARNLAISKSLGIYIAFLDCDDIWDSDWMKMFTSAFVNNDDVSIVYCQFDIFGDGKVRVVPKVKPQSSILTLNEFVNVYRLGMSGSAFKLSVARERDINFESSFMLIEDYDFYLRLCAFGSVMYISNVYAHYRSYSGNLTNKSNTWAEELTRFRKYIVEDRETYKHLKKFVQILDKRINGYILSQCLTDRDYIKAFIFFPLSLLKYILINGLKRPLRR